MYIYTNPGRYPKILASRGYAIFNINFIKPNRSSSTAIDKTIVNMQ